MSLPDPPPHPVPGRRTPQYWVARLPSLTGPARRTAEHELLAAHSAGGIDSRTEKQLLEQLARRPDRADWFAARVAAAALAGPNRALGDTVLRGLRLCRNPATSQLLLCLPRPTDTCLTVLGQFLGRTDRQVLDYALATIRATGSLNAVSRAIRHPQLTPTLGAILAGILIQHPETPRASALLLVLVMQLLRRRLIDRRQAGRMLASGLLNMTERTFSKTIDYLREQLGFTWRRIEDLVVSHVEVSAATTSYVWYRVFRLLEPERALFLVQRLFTEGLAERPLAFPPLVALHELAGSGEIPPPVRAMIIHYLMPLWQRDPLPDDKRVKRLICQLVTDATLIFPEQLVVKLAGEDDAILQTLVEVLARTDAGTVGQFWPAIYSLAEKSDKLTLEAVTNWPVIRLPSLTRRFGVLRDRLSRPGIVESAAAPAWEQTLREGNYYLINARQPVIVNGYDLDTGGRAILFTDRHLPWIYFLDPLDEAHVRLLLPFLQLLNAEFKPDGAWVLALFPPSDKFSRVRLPNSLVAASDSWPHWSWSKALAFELPAESLPVTLGEDG